MQHAFSDCGRPSAPLDRATPLRIRAISTIPVLQSAGRGRDLVAKLNAEANRILLLPDIRRRLNDLGLEVVGGSAEGFSKFIGREVEQLDKLIKSGALTPE